MTLKWMDNGLCRQVDADAFFPEQGRSNPEAKKVCMACEVRTDCLDYALTNDIREGIWGGLSGHQRRQLERQGRRAG